MNHNKYFKVTFLFLIFNQLTGMNSPFEQKREQPLANRLPIYIKKEDQASSITKSLPATSQKHALHTLPYMIVGSCLFSLYGYYAFSYGTMIETCNPTSGHYNAHLHYLLTGIYAGIGGWAGYCYEKWTRK